MGQPGMPERVPVVRGVVAAQPLAQLHHRAHFRQATSASITACRSSGVMPTEDGRHRPRSHSRSAISIGARAGVAERRLAVQRVPHRADPDAGGVEVADQRAQIGNAPRVDQHGRQPPVRPRPRRLAERRHAVHALEGLRIGDGRRALAVEEVLELLELRDPDRRLQIRQPVVEADLVVDPLERIAARLRGERAHPRGHLRVARQHHAAAAGRDDLVAVERQAAGRAVDADPPAPVEGAERLGGVLHHGQRLARADLEQRIEVARVAVEVHRQHGAHAAPGDAVDHDAGRGPRTRASGSRRPVSAIEAPRDRLDIEEDRMGARSGRSHSAVAMKVSAGTSTSSSGPDTGRDQRHVQGRGAVDDGDRVGHADVGGRLALEALDEGPDRGHPVGVEALLDVLPLVAGEMRDGVGNLASAPLIDRVPSCCHHARYQSKVSATPASSDTFGVEAGQRVQPREIGTAPRGRARRRRPRSIAARIGAPRSTSSTRSSIDRLLAVVADVHDVARRASVAASAASSPRPRRRRGRTRGAAPRP